MTPAERIAELEEENAWLKSELGLIEAATMADRLRKIYKITPGQALLLRALYLSRRPLSFDQIMERVPAVTRPDDADSSKHTKVLVHTLRRRLGWAAIETVKMFGYRLSDWGRAQLDRDLSLCIREAA